MIRLYLDEDALEKALVGALRRPGFDCLTANEAGNRGWPDERHLGFATIEGRVLYTKNTADFLRLDAEWREAGRHHAGIVVLTDQRAPIGLQLRALQALDAKLSHEQTLGRLEFLLN